MSSQADADLAEAELRVGTPLIPLTELVGLHSEITHLYTGGEAPVLRMSLEALAEYVADKSAGVAGRRRLEARVEQARLALGKRLNLPHADRRIGFASSVSHVLNVVARSIVTSPGKIVVLDDEFPSLPLAFAPYASEGCTLHFVKSGEHCEERLVSAIDTSTRAVCVSHVSYLTGRRLDLATVAAACQSTGTALVVDASHSAGVITIPVEYCDIVISCGHKFLYGVHGIGTLYWDETRLGPMPVPAPGWNSVDHYRIARGCLDWAPRKHISAMEAGNPNFGALYVLAASLDRLERWPTAKIESHAIGLASLFKAELARRRVPLLTPLQSDRAGSSVSVRCARAAAAAAALADHGVLAAGSDGRLRFSFHAHNCYADVERAVAALVRVGL